MPNAADRMPGIPHQRDDAIGYPCCRIPSTVVTREHSVLAFREGRQSRGDHAQNDIMVKRSGDGGHTWGSVVVVADEGTDSLNDPSAVVDQRTGRVILHYARFAHGYHTDKAVPGHTDPHSSRNMVTFSEDDGETWAPPMGSTSRLRMIAGERG